MTTDPNAGYYQPSLGSLSGFDQINVPTDNPDIGRTGWSISQLQDFLLNTSDINFPTEDWVLKVDELINSHITDYNNPHQVTLDQIIGDVTGEVLSAIVPGTPPDITPFFSYDVVHALPLGDILPVSYTPTNIYRVNEGGMFIDPSSEEEIVGTDYTYQRPGVPLFSPLINSVPSDWASKPMTPVNSYIKAFTNQALNYPFTFYALTENGNTGVFGLTIPASQQPSTYYTLSVFLLASALGGSVILSQPGSPTSTMTIDLISGGYLLSDTTISGDTFMYPSGVIKVSFGFTTAVVPDNNVQIVHLKTGDTSPIRSGTQDNPLFSIFSPTLTTGALHHPVLIDPTKAASMTPMVVNLSKIPVPATMSSLIVTLSITLYPTNTTIPIVDKTIFTFGTFTITRDQTTIYAMISGAVVFTSPILQGLNTVSFSYSPTLLMFKDLATSKKLASGTYLPLSTTTVSVGLFSGYLHYLAIYAMSDTNECLEYLTNG